MRRRKFITGIGAAAIAHALSPVTTRAQQADGVRRMGVLWAFRENAPEAIALLSALTQGLSELGWINGRNLRMDVRWAGDSVEQMQLFAKDLVDLQPDVIHTTSTPATAALQRATQTIQIVFAGISDPVGAGFVSSLAHPGGNLTGFINIEASLAGKWLQLLRDIAPGITRAALIFNPDTAPSGGEYYLPSFEAAARSINVMPIAAPVRSEAEIETVIVSLGHKPPGGFVVMPDNFMIIHRAATILLAAQNKIPAVYHYDFYARDGGLLGYGPDPVDIFRRSASYIDSIFRGAKAADLPVQLPIKFDMTLNVKTARALGLAVPESILLRADEIIQ
jgi:putative ABC transport system substrate-binding protein